VAFDEQPMPELDSEALDFRAASESFAGIRKLARRDLESLRLVGASAIAGREAVINAVAHADYAQHGAPIRLSIWTTGSKSRIRGSSPSASRSRTSRPGCRSFGTRLLREIGTGPQGSEAALLPGGMKGTRVVMARRKQNNVKNNGATVGSRYTEPSTDLRILLEQLKLTLPPQPPPRITSTGHERRGGLVANVALARKLATLFWRVMVKGVDYVEHGLHDYEAKVLQGKQRALERLAKQLGVRVMPETVAA
jgi:hypothetical protein